MIRSNTALDNDTLLAHAPSIFAHAPHEALTERYAFIPTIEVIDAMRKEGLQPVYVNASRPTKRSKEHAKHMIRFRHQDHMQALNVGEEIPEVVLVNSHDGTSTYNLSMGMFRLVCSNGMVVSSANLCTHKVKHSGAKDIVGEIIEGTYEIIKDIPKLQDTINHWKHIKLEPEQELAYARAAHTIKPNEHIQYKALLTSQRYEDNKSDLWRTYNRVQENLMKGNIKGFMDNGRRVTTKPIASVQEDLRVNKSLWQLTERLAEMLVVN